MKDVLGFLNRIMDGYEAISGIIALLLILSSRPVKRLSAYLERYKLRRILALNSSCKDVVLHLPVWDATYEAYKSVQTETEHEPEKKKMVVLEDVLISSSVRKITSELSDTYKLSLGETDRLEPSKNQFYFGGFFPHVFVRSELVRHMSGKLYFSFSKNDYLTMNEEVRNILCSVDENYDHSKSVFINCKYANTDEYEKYHLGKNPNLGPIMIKKPDDGPAPTYIRILSTYDRDVFFIIRSVSKRKNEGTVHICFGLTAATNLAISEMFDRNRSELYKVLKRYNNRDYCLMGFCNHYSNRPSTIDFDSFIDLTDLYYSN